MLLYIVYCMYPPLCGLIFARINYRVDLLSQMRVFQFFAWPNFCECLKKDKKFLRPRNINITKTTYSYKNVAIPTKFLQTT